MLLKALMPLDIHSRSSAEITRQRPKTVDSPVGRTEVSPIDSEVITDPEGRVLTLKDPIDRLGALLGVTENTITPVTLPASWIHATVVVAKDRVQDIESFLTDSRYVMPSTRLTALEDGGNYRFDVLCANETALNYIANAFSALVCPSQTNEARTGLFIPGSGFINKGRTVNGSIAKYKAAEIGKILTLNPRGLVSQPADDALEVTLDSLLKTDDFAASTPAPVTTEAARNALKHAERYKAPSNRISEYKLIPLDHPNLDTIIEDLNNRLDGNHIYCGQLGDYLVVGDCSEQNATLDIARAKNEHNRMAQGQDPKKAKIFVNRGQIERCSKNGALRKVGNLNLRDLGLFNGMSSGDGKPFVALGGALNHLLTHEDLGRAEISERERSKYGTVKTQKMSNGLSVVTDVNLEYFEDKSELVGEEAEAAIQAIIKAFEDPNVEVVYISGDAGFGKTTLMQHAMRKMGRIVATMLGIEADQFVPGENLSRIIRGLAERAEKQFGKNNANFRELFALVYGTEKNPKSSAALRTELTDASSQSRALNTAAFACKAMGIDIAIDDWHFLGTDTQAVEKFYEALGRINIGRKKVIVSRFPDSEYAQKLEERKPGAVARIKAPGVTYDRKNSVEHLEKCLGVKLNAANGEKLLVDGAQALRIGAVSFGNPLYFKSIVASLIDQQAYKTEGGVFKINEDFLADIEAKLTTADDHAVFAANRVASLDRHPMGEGARDFVQAIAILGRLRTASVNQLISKVCPQAVGKETELLTSLTTGLHLREEQDPVTGELYYAPYHNRIGTLIRSQLDVESRLHLQKMLDDTFGGTLDLDTRFKLQMNIINDVDVKTFVGAINNPANEKNAQLLSFVEKFFNDTYAGYSEEMRGRNALEVTRVTAQKILELPVMRAIDAMLSKEDAASIENAKKIIAKNPHIKTVVESLGASLFDIAESAATQGKEEDAKNTIQRLKKLSAFIFIDDFKLGLSEYNALNIGSDSIENFDDAHQAYESLLVLSEKKLNELSSSIAALPDGSHEREEAQYRVHEHITQMALASERLIFSTIKNREFPEDQKSKLLVRLNMVTSAALSIVEEYNLAHAQRHHGIPSPLVLEFLRIRDILLPLEELSAKLGKPNTSLGMGIGAGGKAAGVERDSFLAESVHVVDSSDITTANEIAERCQGLLAISVDKPTAIPPQIRARTINTLIRMYKYLGKFDQAYTTALDGVSLALNTGNYNAALPVLSQATHALRFRGSTQPGEKNGLAQRNNTQLDPILAACDLLFDKEAKTIQAHTKENQYLSFYMLSTRLEAVADISPSNISLTAEQAAQPMIRADAAKISEAKLNLKRIAETLQNATGSMNEASPYGFAPAWAIGGNVRAGQFQSYVIPAFAEVCTLIRSFNTDKNVKGLGYSAIDYAKTLRESPLLTPENIWAAVLYHAQAEHKDPAFENDYNKRTEALHALLLDSIGESSDLTELIALLENTALRYDLDGNGECDTNEHPPSTYDMSDTESVSYYRQADVISMHTPFAVTAQNKPIFEAIKARAKKLMSENPKDGKMALSYIRTAFLNGDICDASKALHEKREMCANDDTAQYLALQARMSLISAKTNRTESGSFDIKRTVDFDPQELHLAFKAAETLDTFRSTVRAGSMGGATSNAPTEKEADIEAMLLQLDAVASLSRKIIKVLKRAQFIDTLKSHSSKPVLIDIELLAQSMASTINKSRGNSVEKCTNAEVLKGVNMFFRGTAISDFSGTGFTSGEFTFAFMSTQVAPRNGATPRETVEQMIYEETGETSKNLGINTENILNYLINEGLKRGKPPLDIFDQIKNAPLENNPDEDKLKGFIERAKIIDMMKSSHELLIRLDAYNDDQKKSQRPMSDVQRNFALGFARASWNFIEGLIDLLPAIEKEHLGLTVDKGALDIFELSETGAVYTSRDVFVNRTTIRSRLTDDVTFRGI